ASSTSRRSERSPRFSLAASHAGDMIDHVHTPPIAAPLEEPARKPRRLGVHIARFLILYALLRPIALLPYGFQLAVGRAFGRFAHAVAKRPRRIARCTLPPRFP